MKNVLNIKKVIAGYKTAEKIGIYSDNGINYITDGTSIFQVDDAELWEVQTALKIKESNGYFEIVKKGGACPVLCGEFPARIFDVMNRAKEAEGINLTDTGLYAKNRYTLYTLFARDSGYVALSDKYRAMIIDNAEFKQSGQSLLSPIVVDGMHVICPIGTDEEARNGVLQYLKPC